MKLLEFLQENNTPRLDDDTITWWSNYAKNVSFDTEEEAREFVFHKLQFWESQPSFQIFGVKGTKENKQIAQSMPLYKEGGNYKIGRPIEEKPKSFSWDDFDLLPVEWTTLFSYGLVNQFDIDEIKGPVLVDIEKISPVEKPHTEHAEKLANEIEDNMEFRPIVLDDNLAIVDGHHRLEAAKLLKTKNIPAYIVYLK